MLFHWKCDKAGKSCGFIKFYDSVLPSTVIIAIMTVVEKYSQFFSQNYFLEMLKVLLFTFPFEAGSEVVVEAGAREEVAEAGRAEVEVEEEEGLEGSETGTTRTVGVEVCWTVKDLETGTLTRTPRMRRRRRDV